MQEMNMFKKLSLPSAVVLCLIVGFAVDANAQYEDTAVYRKNRVKTVESWVNFMQFENSEDTCLYEIKRVNEMGLPTYLKQDYNCHGWDMIAESSIEYDDKGRITHITNTQNDLLSSDSKMWYDEHNRVIREESKYIEPYALILVTNQYFGPEQEPDSMISIWVTNGDSIRFRSVFTYELGKITREDLVDMTEGKPVSSRALEYDIEQRLIRDKFILMQSYDEDQITKFEYNDDGGIFRTSSEINKTAAEFYYNSAKLLVKTFYYNKFETMERQVWHKYTFWE